MAPVGLRVADARLVLPHAVHRAAVLPGAPGWADALERASVMIVDPGAAGIDLVVAPASRVREAANTGATSVIALGQAAGPLGTAGYATTRLLQRRGPDGPRLLVPLGARGPLRHMLIGPAPGRTALRRLRNRAAIRLAAAGARLGNLVVTVGTRRAGPPRFLAAAKEIGLPDRVDWALDLGDQDDLQRAIWLCFLQREAAPRWALKCSRVPGYRAPFDRDEAGLALLNGLPDEVRDHAPRLLGRFEVDGLHASLESAAPGVPLHKLLDGLVRGDDAIALVRCIAEWTTALGRATASSSAALESELERLDAEVVPAWSELALPSDLARGLAGVPAVVQHNDLGTWNILSAGRDFTVVDWESARPIGLPLWDLVYFGTDALSTIARPMDPAGKFNRCLQLLRGELPGSTQLFRLTARAARDLGVPIPAVGRVITLCWLHHGLSHPTRRRALGDISPVSGDDDNALRPHLEALAPSWVEDPALGLEWPAFVAAAA